MTRQVSGTRFSFIHCTLMIIGCMCVVTGCNNGGNSANQPVTVAPVRPAGIPDNIDMSRIDTSLKYYFEYWKNDNIMRIGHRGLAPNGKYERHGLYTQYYADGTTVERAGQYTYGERTGPWIFYGPDGTVINENDFGSR